MEKYINLGEITGAFKCLKNLKEKLNKYDTPIKALEETYDEIDKDESEILEEMKKENETTSYH